MQIRCYRLNFVNCFGCEVETRFHIAGLNMDFDLHYDIIAR